MRIVHTADVQVKNRSENLYLSTNKTLKYIEKLLAEGDEDTAYVIAGDFFEFAHLDGVNDSERKLIYNHLSRVLNIRNVKEVILMAGNHDLLKEKKQTENTTGHNVINIFTDLMKNFDSSKSEKITYLSESKLYKSKITDKIVYGAYSLEDGMAIDFSNKKEDQFLLCVFHDMLKDFVDEDKIPLRKDIYNGLMNIDQFPADSIILAGDIHKPLKYEGLSNQLFFYPGSPMQHTHSEGTYIKIGEKVTHKHAPKKLVKQYLISDDKLFDNTILTQSDFEISDLTIPTQICYNTIVLDNKITIDKVLNSIINDAEILFGLEQTIIKVKSSNIFLTEESVIDAHLKTLSEDRGAKRVKVKFDYEKFIDTNAKVSNKAVQDIVNEKQNELKKFDDTVEGLDQDGDFTLSSENIDNLLLSEAQLIKLFMSVLETQLKTIVSDDIPENELSDDLKALFAKELKEFNTDDQRYNIVFESIETTGFMSLLANKIPLNIPGIIRILGTNGIGKTTLYNMIRWTITGLVYPNLTKNQYVKNNLIVFNKNLPGVDFVDTKLTLNINGKKIVAHRHVDRKWKNNTTDEQKSSLDWRDYVSAVNRSFKLHIYVDGEETPREFVGEQAESTLNGWFGSTLNSITFMNQTSLENLLATNPLELNNLILNFIGVDYLKKLEGNLDNVKTDLMSVPRPKLAKESIRESITDTKIYIKKAQELLKEAEEIQSHGNTELTNEQEKLKELNQNLVDIGNIPTEIEETEAAIKTNQSAFDNFEEQKRKDLVIFTEQKPTLDEKNQIPALEGQIEERDKIINDNNKIINEVIERKTTIFDIELPNKIKEELERLNTSLTGFTTDKTKVETKIKDIYKQFADEYGTIVTQLGEKAVEKTKLVAGYDAEIKKYEEDIASREKQIESGVCGECGKPLNDNPEEHEQHVIRLRTEIEEITGFIQETDGLRQKENLNLQNISKFSKLYTDYRDKAMQMNVALLEIEQIKKDRPESVKLLQDAIKLLAQLNVQIDACSTVINDVNGITDKLRGENYEVNFDSEDINPIVDELKTIMGKSAEASKLVSEHTVKKTGNAKDIQKIKDAYNTALETYNKNLEQNVKDNEDIRKFNDGVDEHNKKKITIESELNRLKLHLNVLIQEKLPDYNTAKNAVTAKETLISNITSDIGRANTVMTEQKLEIQRQENTLKDWQKQYDDYLQYQKNNIMWKVYSKLIKNQFKDIVFQYYRTFLNKTLNTILEDVNFKLYWNDDSELIHVGYKNQRLTYQLVQQSSGMETCFLALALVYTMHLLNVKNTLSHIFIDEISGTLNEGKDLSYDAENYKELLVLILNKFKDKSIFIIDHNINNLYESVTYEVLPQPSGSIYKQII